MDFFEALPLVVGSYLAFGAMRRRVRLVVGRRRGAGDPAFRIYHHHALLQELPHRGPANAQGEPVIPAPNSPRFGAMPEPWASSGWFLQDPGPLAGARDLLLAGAPVRAAQVAADVAGAKVAAQMPPDVAAGAAEAGAQAQEHGGGAGGPVDLFVWAAACRIWAGQLEAAWAIAEAMAPLEGAEEPMGRLLAWVEVLRAEAGKGTAALEAADRALLRLDDLGAALDATPAWACLPAQVAILRLVGWRLEWDLFEARRRLRQARRHHGGAPLLLFCQAHLAASFGDGREAAELLAKALYHSRGDRFFAWAILALQGIQWSHPALFTRASAAAAHSGDVDTNRGPALESAPPHRGPSA